jgi:hypothetical protein
MPKKIDGFCFSNPKMTQRSIQGDLKKQKIRFLNLVHTTVNIDMDCHSKASYDILGQQIIKSWVVANEAFARRWSYDLQGRPH